MSRLFDNYMIELQTNARQYLTPLRVMEYLDQLRNRKEYEKWVEENNQSKFLLIITD